jgi:repressor of nif and glnA expression
MIQSIESGSERIIISILKILSENSKPLGATTIARRLKYDGVSLGERGVRYHLKISDLRGYTQLIGREGRIITSEGRQEIKEAFATQQLGFVRERLKALAFQTTFDPEKRTGKLPINTSLIKKSEFKRAISAMEAAFKAGICVSNLVSIAQEGDKLGSVVIPDGHIGLATVCSVVINGVLLRGGVSCNYRFGGVLQIRYSRPKRFIGIIEYSGTSLDPSEQFIRAKMTSVNEAIKTGSGKILGVFRTIPALAKEVAENKMALLREAGISGVYTLGNIGEPLYETPVEPNRIGMVQLSGLNPTAAACEAGIEIESVAESGLINYEELQNFKQILF